MLSYTVLERSRLKCWKIIPIFLRTSRSRFSSSFVSSVPSTVTVPSVGRSNRLMHRTSVDFPAPENPMIPKSYPVQYSNLPPLRHGLLRCRCGRFCLPSPTLSCIFSPFGNKKSFRPIAYSCTLGRKHYFVVPPKFIRSSRSRPQQVRPTKTGYTLAL